MKMFIVSTDNRNPDDFETWVVGAFNSLEDAKNAAIRSVETGAIYDEDMKEIKEA